MTVQEPFAAASLQESLRALLKDLMLIPGISGHESRVRRRIAAELDHLGLSSRSDRLGNVIATLEGIVRPQPSCCLPIWISLA